MKGPLQEPLVRWVDAPGEARDADRAADLIRALAPPSTLSAVARARIEQALASTRRHDGRADRRLAWAAAAVLVAGTGAVLAATGTLPLPRLRPPPTAPVVGPPPPFGAPPSAAPRVEPSPVTPPPSGPEREGATMVPHAAPLARSIGSEASSAQKPTQASRPEPAPPSDVRAPVPPPREAVSGAPSVALAGPTPTGPDPSLTFGRASEAQLLRHALRRLRGDADPQGALIVLDELALRFPDGDSAGEARVARGETLAALGLKAAALATLRSTIAGPVVTPATRFQRAEVLSRLGACADALLDLGAIIPDDGPLDQAQRRALSLRVTCRARLGDREGLARDRARYRAPAIAAPASGAGR